MFNRVKVTVRVDGLNDSIETEVEREYLSSGDIDSTIASASAEAAARATRAVARAGEAEKATANLRKQLGL